MTLSLFFKEISCLPWDITVASAPGVYVALDFVIYFWDRVFKYIPDVDDALLIRLFWEGMTTGYLVIFG